jgi:hypothetical protein
MPENSPFGRLVALPDTEIAFVKVTGNSPHSFCFFLAHDKILSLRKRRIVWRVTALPIQYAYVDTIFSSVGGTVIPYQHEYYTIFVAVMYEVFVNSLTK